MQRLASRGKMGILVFLLCGVLTGIAFGMGVSPKTPIIAIRGQAARMSPPLLGVCSVFMEIENSGNEDDTLVSAKTDIQGTITEFHDMKDGKMVKREKVPVPAGRAVEMRPGGLHIMVLKLPRDARVGYEFTLRLKFERSGERTVVVSIGR